AHCLTPGRSHGSLVDQVTEEKGDSMSFQRAFVCVIGLCLFSAVAPAGAGAYMTDYNAHEVPCTSCPASPPWSPLTNPNPSNDPVFQTTITRRTDPSMSPNDGTNKTLGLI